MEEDEQTFHFEISEDTLNKWQNIVNIIAELLAIPAALIMRLDKADIEIFVASQTAGNPYHAGDHEELIGSGLYCETVINKNDKLLVANAKDDEKWKNNPAVKDDMISYLGFPILQPDGKAFGTICVLDNKENAYSETYEKLILNFRDIIQNHLELSYLNYVIGGQNRQLNDYIAEIKMLRGFLPICSFCKKIRDDEGYWQAIENYISQHTAVKFSHGVCPECRKKHYPDLKGKRKG